MAEKVKVFVSAVTAEFGSLRNEIARQLGAMGFEVWYQEIFSQIPEEATLLDKIRYYVDLCDLGIFIVGHKAGCLSKPDEIHRYKNDRRLPEGWQQVSYTQWEFFLSAMPEVVSEDKTPLRLPHIIFVAMDRGDDECKDDDLQAQFRNWLVHLTCVDREAFDNEDFVIRRIYENPKLRILRPHHRPFNLRHSSLGSRFVRGDFLQSQIQRRYEESRNQGHTFHRRFITGLGGQGKTQTAVEYAHRYKHQFDAVLFVSASSVEDFETSFAELHAIDALNLSDYRAKSREEQRDAVVRALNAEYANWLLIIDNIDDPHVAKIVARQASQLTNGFVLATGRRQLSLGAAFDEIVLPDLDVDAGARCILSGIQGGRIVTEQEQIDARRLAEELGGHPQALELVANCVSKYGETISEYRERWIGQCKIASGLELPSDEITSAVAAAQLTVDCDQEVSQYGGVA